MTPENISRLADLLRLIDKDIPEEEEGYDPYDPMEDCPTCGVWWQSEGATCSTCLAYKAQHDACLTFLKEFPARDLADEVLRLTPLLANAEDRIARLERVLAVEQGDESQAPEGWRPQTVIGTEWAHEGRSLLVMRGFRWCWYDDKDDDKRGIASTALEAMEAADRAARGEG